MLYFYMSGFEGPISSSGTHHKTPLTKDQIAKRLATFRKAPTIQKKAATLHKQDELTAQNLLINALDHPYPPTPPVQVQRRPIS